MSTTLSTRRRVGIALTCASLALGAVTLPASAAKGKPAPPPTESGCYDIVGGEGGPNSPAGDVTRIKQTTTTTETKTRTDPGTIDLAGTPLAGSEAETVAALDDSTETYEETTTTTTFTDDVRVSLILTLAAPSCTDARYRLRVTDEAGAFVTEVVVAGDGASDKVRWVTEFAYPRTGPNPDEENREVTLSVTSESVGGSVGDTAPAAAENGVYPVASGGGNLGWS